MENEMLTITKAAERAGVASSTLRHAIKTRKLRATRLGVKIWVIFSADLERWQANRKMGRPPKSR